ncbi:MAG TPA: hypothetical protein VFZ78_12335, partial [Flavisolibacter sp.]
LVLMASVTSLPELMTGVSATVIVRSADLAVGDIFGSCAFNLFILAMLDAFVPRHQSIFGIASQTHILAAAMSIILLSLAGAGLFLPAYFSVGAGLGLISVACIVIYLVSIRVLYRFEVRRKAMLAASEEKRTAMQMPLRKVILRYALFAAIIIGAALLLPYFANHIAEQASLSKSFVGTLFVAVSTSLPEIAVSIAAIRLGSIDLAVGNLLGSNIFNILILSLDDLFYSDAVLLHDASDANILSVFSTLLMTAIAIAGLMFHAETKRYRMALDAFLIFAVYLLNLLLLYKLDQ